MTRPPQPWGVSWTSPAVRDMRRLDRTVAQQVRTDVQRLAQIEQGDVKQLTGVKPRQWRLRSGDWRVRFIYQSEARMLVILRVLPRGRAYERR